MLSFGRQVVFLPFSTPSPGWQTSMTELCGCIKCTSSCCFSATANLLPPTAAFHLHHHLPSTLNLPIKSFQGSIHHQPRHRIDCCDFWDLSWLQTSIWFWWSQPPGLKLSWLWQGITWAEDQKMKSDITITNVKHQKPAPRSARALFVSQFWLLSANKTINQALRLQTGWGTGGRNLRRKW